jgi:acetyl esterase
MPLDPQVQAFLAAQAAVEVPPISEQTPQMAREGYTALAQMLGPGEAVDTEDRSVPGPAGDSPVRIYTPEGEGPRGVLVYYHGGGFVIGDLDTHDHACRALCKGAGVVVVSVDYRLAPEHRFPAAVEDSWAALEWVAANAASFGGDPARLAVGGDSAGGNLAAVMSLLARDRGGPRLAFQLLVYPGVDIRGSFPSIEENGEGYVLTKGHIEWFRNHYLGDADPTDLRASPLLAESHAGLPPALIQTAEFDPLRDEGAAYADKLRAAGVPATLTCYEGMVHIFFQLTPLLDGAKAAMAEACEAVRGALAE